MRLPLWNIRLKNKTGASLVELLVVCTAIVLLAGLSIQYLSIIQRSAVRTEAALLYTACRFMQRLACATQQEQRLILDPIHNSYRYHGIEHRLHHQVQFGFMPNTKGPPASPEYLVHKPITFVDNAIIFYPTGIISAGTIYITDAHRSCCYALSNGVAQVSCLRMYIYKKSWEMI